MRTGLFADGNRPDVYTFHAARDVLPEELAATIVREAAVSRLPGIRQRGHHPGRWRYLLPLMPRYFAALDLSAYDLVISSSHAFAVNVRPRPDALHLCYCYTPIRYAWLPGTDERRLPRPAALALGVLRGWFRGVDLDASARPAAYAAISTAVRDRIRRFYGREAAVIHPPVDVDEFDATSDKDPHHFLWVHRLVPYKRPEEVLEAFRGLPYRLTMVGVGPLEQALRERLPPNVELHGWFPRDELARLYARCGGFVHVGEEDFGITMVEALASGTPVVALGAGGARDIVRPGVDGVLVDAAKPEAIRDSVRRVAEERWDAGALAARAREFSRQRFVERLRSWIEDVRRSR